MLVIDGLFKGLAELECYAADLTTLGADQKRRDISWRLGLGEDILDQTIRLWDVQSGKELYRLAGHTDKLWTVACSADGCYALSGSFDKTLRLWRLPK